MPFDLNAAQEAARNSLTGGNFVGEDMKSELVRTHRGFYVHNVYPRQFRPKAGGDAVDQWAFDIEFFDDEAEQEAIANEGQPVLYTMTFGANPYREPIARAMKDAIETEQIALGPFKIWRDDSKTGRPYDFAAWVKGVDDAPVSRPVGRAAATSFKPRPRPDASGAE